MSLVTGSLDAREILERARVIAVLGAHVDGHKAAHYVPDYLARVGGYRILPVNPRYEGQILWGEPVRATLAELEEPVDMVDVFRRGAHLPAHLDDILAMSPAPSVIWFQLGVRNRQVAEALIEAGFDLVTDRCTMADHRAFGLSRRQS